MFNQSKSDNLHNFFNKPKLKDILGSPKSKLKDEDKSGGILIDRRNYLMA